MAALISMISQERSVKVLLDELLGVGGCNLSLRPARTYCRPDEVLSFNALSKRALESGEILLGYQHADKERRRAGLGDGRKSINPRHKLEPQGGWGDYDMVVLEGEAMGFDYDEENDAGDDAQQQTNKADAAGLADMWKATGGGGFGGRGRANPLSAFNERIRRKNLADIGKERRDNAKERAAREQFQHVLQTQQRLKQVLKKGPGGEGGRGGGEGGGRGNSGRPGAMASKDGGVSFSLAGDGQDLPEREEHRVQRVIASEDEAFEKKRRRKSSTWGGGLTCAPPLPPPPQSPQKVLPSRVASESRVSSEKEVFTPSCRPKAPRAARSD